MLKIVLIALLLSAETGEVKSVISPVPAFETLEQCREAIPKLPAAPPDSRLRATA